MPVPQIFVAGPYTGNVPSNSSSSLELCVQVAKAGGMPICANVFTDPRFMEVQDYNFWIRATKETLKRCDAVIFTHDFERSSGAKGEEVEAKRLGIPRFYNAEDLEDWIQTQRGVNRTGSGAAC